MFDTNKQERRSGNERMKVSDCISALMALHWTRSLDSTTDGIRDEDNKKKLSSRSVDQSGDCIKLGHGEAGSHEEHRR